MVCAHAEDVTIQRLRLLIEHAIQKRPEQLSRIEAFLLASLDLAGIITPQLAEALEPVPEEADKQEPVLPENSPFQLDGKTILSFEQYEALIIRHALEVCKNSPSATARALRIGRATIYRKARQYKIPMHREVADDDV